MIGSTLSILLQEWARIDAELFSAHFACLHIAAFATFPSSYQSLPRACYGCLRSSTPSWAVLCCAAPQDEASKALTGLRLFGYLQREALGSC